MGRKGRMDGGGEEGKKKVERERKEEGKEEGKNSLHCMF